MMIVAVLELSILLLWWWRWRKSLFLFRVPLEFFFFQNTFSDPVSLVWSLLSPSELIHPENFTRIYYSKQNKTIVIKNKNKNSSRGCEFFFWIALINNIRKRKERGGFKKNSDAGNWTRGKHVRDAYVTNYTTSDNYVLSKFTFKIINKIV